MMRNNRTHLVSIKICSFRRYFNSSAGIQKTSFPIDSTIIHFKVHEGDFADFHAVKELLEHINLIKSKQAIVPNEKFSFGAVHTVLLKLKMFGKILVAVLIPIKWNF